MTHPRQTVVRAHVTQDKHGFWMTSLELPNGKLSLAIHGEPELELGNAYDPEDLDLPPDTEFYISMSDKEANFDADVKKPRAKKATPPYYVIKNGEKVREVLK
jgi:hypothetical protein